MADLFEALFSLIIDSIVSELSFDFVQALKDNLLYEINLVTNLEIKL